MDVESYNKLILETLYNGFMNNPPFQIENSDVENIFGIIQNQSNFKIAKEQLIKDRLLYGINVNLGKPPYLLITGEGLIHYENNFIFPSENKEYTVLFSKILAFLRDVGEKKYDISKFIKKVDERRKIAEISRDYINEIIKSKHNYEMNDLKWKMLFFTSRLINKHIMGISGIGIGNDYLSLYDPDSFSLNSKGVEFLNYSFLKEKFQTIKDDFGRNRVIQIYNDITSWIIKKRWVDITINMGAIIEYCIDNYAELKGLHYILKKRNLHEKLALILQNPKLSSDSIFKPEFKTTWKRIQNILKDWRNYIHISKLVKERSPIDENSIQKFYPDFEKILNILLNL